MIDRIMIAALSSRRSSSALCKKRQRKDRGESMGRARPRRCIPQRLTSPLSLPLSQFHSARYYAPSKTHRGQLQIPEQQQKMCVVLSAGRAGGGVASWLGRGAARRAGLGTSQEAFPSACDCLFDCWAVVPSLQGKQHATQVDCVPSSPRALARSGNRPISRDGGSRTSPYAPTI
jgi:hypothetical protein